MICHLLSVLQRTLMLQLIGDAGSPHGMIADLRFDARLLARRSIIR